MSSDGRRIDRVMGAMLAGALLCGALLSPSCADFSRGELAAPVMDAGGGGDGTTADGGGTLSYAADIHPLLVPSCSRCHADGLEAGDTQLLFTGTPEKDHETVLRFVDTSSPAGSRLLAKMSGNGHQGGAVYASGSPEFLTVLHWIEQGAPQ